MVLNWNLEVITGFLLTLVVLIAALITYIKPRTRKITSVFFIRICFFCASASMALDSISLLIVSEPLSILAGYFYVPLTLSLIVGINYIMKETFFSIGFMLAFGISILFIYLGFQPGAVETRIQGGYVRIPWIGLFGDLAMILLGFTSLYSLYWGIKTFKNVPLMLKKEAYVFLIGILISSPVLWLLYFLYLIEPSFILFSNAAGMIGFLIISISFLLEPKLLYILPFTVYRIIVKDRMGYPLYDYDWSKSTINENTFTGFINAVQLMSDEIVKMGGLLDINLKEGILILHESENITVGLAASKSSKLLQNSLTQFTVDFEAMFQKKLKQSCHDKKEYETAYELIEKHFSNFPSRLVTDKSHPLLLTEKLLKLPNTLDHDLKKIIPDKGDYEFIKSEIFRSPESSAASFISLYHELKEELEKSDKERNQENDFIEMK